LGPVRNVATVVIGAGHAGLAMSRCLSERGIEHVVLERGEIANSWRKERWDSLRLLTPNWQSRLPGFGYDGDDPDGYRTMPEIIGFLDRYAQVIKAPVETHTRVTSLERDDGGYRVATDKGEWLARTVVIASGACNRAHVPAFAAALPDHVVTLSSMDYKNPEQLARGGVLVVGASATGTQLAYEIQHSGRPVTISVGEHIRMPRLYRGKDIAWWMDKAGVWDERYDEVEDIVRARRVPSLQLTGSDERKTLDLNALTSIGVKLVGKFAAIAEGKALFSGSLKNQCALSDLKMGRLLDAIDLWAKEQGFDGEAPPAERLAPTHVEEKPPLTLDFGSSGVCTILWATGYSPDYSWLKPPVLDRKSHIRHDGGVVTSSPGLYVMGLQFLRRRKSALIDGAGDDARDLSEHLAAYLDGRTIALPRRERRTSIRESM
jgi:putative flavoprotein involved in K+ transport